MEQPNSFTWSSCEGNDDGRRIAIKEEALGVGIRHCKHLIEKLERVLHNAHANDASNSTVLGREILEKWINDCKSLIDRHKEFRVLVGVAGPTGSGKTSALNALLEAATAVPCRIAYNQDDRSSMKFRACVTFRNKSGLTKQLKQFYEDLQSRDELRDSSTGSAEDYEALRNANANLKPTFEMIRTIFGLEEKDVVKMTPQDLLDSNQDVSKLLGTTKRYHSSNAEQLSEQIKPYLDSTVAQHTKLGAEFAAWPLVDEVEVFVKSDVLRDGVVLVDLPGLADSVESRAAIAEAYFPKLAATLIVTPARRAADDSTSVKLMSDHQELQMQMNGKFHKRSYCVVVSQIDQLERSSALRTREAKSNAELQELLQEEKRLKLKKQDKENKSKSASRELKKLQAAWRATTSTGNKRRKGFSGVSKNTDPEEDYKKLIKSQRAVSVKARAEVDAANEKVKDVGGHIHYLCVKNRNEFFEGRIQHDFERRQANITTDDHKDLKDTYDGRVSICPISAKAFWQCSPGEEPLMGFPSQLYSGIPNLAHWTRHATIPEREIHADSLLHDLRHCFNIIQTWSKEEWSHNRLEVNKEWIQEQVFPSVYAGLQESLNTQWAAVEKDVRKCSPLKGQKHSINSCAEECTKVVKRWSYKIVNDEADRDRIHWITYQANIKRKGDKFLSRSGEGQVEYNWMENVSDVLLRTIVADWNQALNHNIPGLARPAAKRANMAWKEFIERVRFSVEEVIPRLSPFLEEIIPKLDVIKEQIKDKMRQALRDLSKGASEVHPDLVKEIQRKWNSTFKNAGKMKGKGSFKEREEIIIQFAVDSGRMMFNAAFTRLRKQLNDNFNRLPDILKSITKFALQAVQDQIEALLDNALLPDIKMEGALEEKVKLQHDIRGILFQWDVQWTVPGSSHTNVEEFAIPSEYHGV
ncbi:uncharacterized protein F4822DRAFT_444534 [Hypoxylon trugodes]|uniref:uncharacterized protein n=1 Tax=Hypoxylon trugodes TaxID=326681 RepID=UPI0021A18E6D|nr:uncharacterized protein F4822DRAFT_444534 [Hypoxylon trugodes]KAI1388070.1 hypothetical protein F4822DRAFT_444534 [Hypoxylon trugodes]